MGTKRTILSDSDGDDLDGATDNPTTLISDVSSGRPSRKTKEAARKKWEPLVPGQPQKKKKVILEPENDSRGSDELTASQSKVLPDRKSKRSSDNGNKAGTHRKHDKSNTSTHRARRIDPNAVSSEDEPQEHLESRELGSKGRKMTQTHGQDPEHKSASTVPPKFRKTKQSQDQGESDTGEDDEHRSGSADEEDDAEQSDEEDDGLVEMEKNPETLRRTLEQETAHWVSDNELSSPDLPKPRSRVSRKVSPSRSASQRSASRHSSHPLPPTSREPSDSGDDAVSTHPYSQKGTLPAGSKHHVQAIHEDSSSESEVEAPPAKKPYKNVPTDSAGHPKAEREKRSYGHGHRSQIDSQTAKNAFAKPRQVSASTRGAQDTSSKRLKSRREDEIPKFKDSDTTKDSHKTKAKERSEAPAPKKTRSRSKTQVDSDEDTTIEDASDTDSDSDDSGIDAVLPQRGKIKLGDQHRRIRRVVKRGIYNMLIEVCTKNAFPDGAQKHGKTVYRSLLRAAEEFEYDDVVKRLKKDDNYATKLCQLPAQRISTHRNQVRRLAEGQACTAFGLKFGDLVMGNWLQDGRRYIYPFNYENDTIKKNQPYSPPVYVEMIRAAWFKHAKAFGFKILDRFVSSLPEKPDEKEIPASMLALVATALHAAIDHAKHGRPEAIEFKANTYWSVYTDHIQELSTIRSRGPAQYHTLMHGLWRQIVNPSGPSQAPHKSFLDVENMAVE